MKITKSKLKRIIKEELEAVMGQGGDMNPEARRGLSRRKLAKLMLAKLPESFVKYAKESAQTIKEDPRLALENIAGVCANMWRSKAPLVAGECSRDALKAAAARCYQLGDNISKKIRPRDVNELFTFIPSRPKPMALRKTAAWAKFCADQSGDSDL
jgi:hypothetical protein